MTRAWVTAIVFAAMAVGIGVSTGPLTTAFGQTKQDPFENKSATPPDNKKTITVKHCKIKLIDQVKLAASRSGILAFVEPREGDPVRAEQTVARLKDELVQAQLKTAKQQAENDVEIRFAEEATKFAEVDLEKLLAINRKSPGTIPDIDVKEKELAVTKAKLQIEQAKWQKTVSEYKAEEMSAALEQFGVVAPIDGIVTEVLKSKGEAVREGDTILEITNTKRLKVEGNLHFKDAWRVKQGDLVTVRLEIKDDSLEVTKRTFKGRIRFVDVEVHTLIDDVLIWAEVENTDNLLRAGLQATMVIELNAKNKQRAAVR